ncbi:MAG TPA: acyltransferase, partial [Actinomycetes bacterium]|nr:acyltransferase [Actinomycetes bacterium]
MLRSGSLAPPSRQESLESHGNNNGPTGQHTAPQTAPRSSGGFPKALPYLPGLDGIRAVAVVAVLLFHLPARLLPGGFLGVDVFFVLSGFLITTLLLAELEATGRVRFGDFYRRRARRLLPALIAVLLVSTVLVLTVARDAASVFRQDAIAALTYTTNWWYIFDARTYFELLGRPPLLQHLWSLGIEEQFYLVWPTVCFLVWRRWRRRGVGIVALTGAVVGTVWMTALGVTQGPLDPTNTARLYFGADTHAMTVLAGAALAVVWRPSRLPLRIPTSAQVSLIVAGAFSLLGLS